MEVFNSIVTSLVTADTEPISVSEAKTWALIDTSADDTVIGSIITSAREMVEAFISRDLVAKNRVVYIDNPDATELTIKLPYPANTSEVTIVSDGVTLIEDDNYEFVGIDGRYIKFYNCLCDLTITYKSAPISDPSELNLAKNSTRVLIEQIYDARGNVESDVMPVVLNMNLRTMLTPLKSCYV